MALRQLTAGVYVIACDGEGCHRLTPPTCGAARARLQARIRGWIMRAADDKDYCPVCQWSRVTTPREERRP